MNECKKCPTPMRQKACDEAIGFATLPQGSSEVSRRAIFHAGIEYAAKLMSRYATRVEASEGTTFIGINLFHCSECIDEVWQEIRLLSGEVDLESASGVVEPVIEGGCPYAKDKQ